MAKDPAFLFYPSDFIMGTLHFSNEEVGIYIKLLCFQHQHGDIIPEDIFVDFIGDSKRIERKFEKDDKGYYNERLREERGKRNSFCESRRKNATKGKQVQSTSKASANHMGKHMEDEDEDVNRDRKELKIFILGVEKKWNDFASKHFQLSKVRSITATRRKHLRERYKNKDFRESFDQVLEEIPKSSFLMGKNDREWVVDFDFLIKNDDNYHKILEGKYEDDKTKNPALKRLEESGLI